jgi:hypothetical protein
MDDGNNHESGYELNTCSFTIPEIKLLQFALKDKFGLDSSIRSRNIIYIKANSKKRFLKYIIPHFHESMLYKIEKK